jgi:hypothetical protein
MASRLGHDLVSVRGTDCCDGVGKLDSPFEKREPAIEFQTVEVVIGRRKASPVPLVEGIHSLISQVVDRQQCAERVLPMAWTEYMREEWNGKGRLPVIGVKDIEREIHDRRKMKEGMVPNGKPFQIVFILGTAFPVKPRTIEEAIRIDGVDRD